MDTFLPRNLYEIAKARLTRYPVVAVLGARQCGKSTIAKQLIRERNSLYLDLESLADLNKLQDPEIFFEINKGQLICLDEIQRRPELFPVLRSIVDQRSRPGQLLILGSASRDLIRQSSESLAGRISYLELTPFYYPEVEASADSQEVLRKLWLRGGFPRSYLAETEEDSFQWRTDFVKTFLERDIPQLGFNVPAMTMQRLWRMCAHSQGQLLNSSKLGDSLGLGHTKVRSYLDLLAQTFVIRILEPYHANVKKRLVKSPKIYIRDSGLLHNLLGLESLNDLLGHPVYGASWEGFVLENILTAFPDWNAFFYRTSHNTEIDLILEKGNRRIGIECKASSAPRVNRGFWNVVEDLELEKTWIIAPVDAPYLVRRNAVVSPLAAFLEELTGMA